MPNANYCLGLYEKAMPSGLTWREMLALTHISGFDTLEISIDETDARLARLDWTREERLALRRDSEAAEVPVKTMCLSGHRRYPLGSRDKDIRARAADVFRKAVRLSEDIGVRIIQLAGYDVYYEETGADTVRYFEENLRLCAEYAAARGVLLGFETMETPFMDTLKKSMFWVSRVNSPYLGVYPDIGNLKNASLLHNHDLLEDIGAGRGHIVAAHLKETVPGVYRDMDFGAGHTEYGPCIRLLYGMGIRHFTGEFWYQGEADYEDKLRGAAQFLRRQIELAIA